MIFPIVAIFELLMPAAFIVNLQIIEGEKIAFSTDPTSQTSWTDSCSFLS